MCIDTVSHFFTDKSFKVVCYYTNWSQYRPEWARFQPEDIDASLCSHVIFAFAAVKEGKLSFVEWNDESSLTSTGNKLLIY